MLFDQRHDDAAAHRSSADIDARGAQALDQAFETERRLGAGFDPDARLVIGAMPDREALPIGELQQAQRRVLVDRVAGDRDRTVRHAVAVREQQALMIPRLGDGGSPARRTTSPVPRHPHGQPPARHRSGRPRPGGAIPAPIGRRRRSPDQDRREDLRSEPADPRPSPPRAPRPRPKACD